METCGSKHSLLPSLQSRTFEKIPSKVFHSDNVLLSFSLVGKRRALISLNSWSMTKTLKNNDQFKEPL